MIQFSRNATGDIGAFRSMETAGIHHGGDAYEIGSGLRYTSGAYVIGMEFQPDWFNGKTERPRLNVCPVCGRVVAHIMAKYCGLHSREERGKNIRATAARKRQAREE